MRRIVPSQNTIDFVGLMNVGKSLLSLIKKTVQELNLRDTMLFFGLE